MVSQLLAVFLSPCSTHQLTAEKENKKNVHTVAAHGISMNTASHTRLQLPSPHGRKENTPTFHTVTHGIKENKQGCTWYIIIEHTF